MEMEAPFDGLLVRAKAAGKLENKQTMGEGMTGGGGGGRENIDSFFHYEL